MAKTKKKLQRFPLHERRPSWDPRSYEFFTTDDYWKAQRGANLRVEQGAKHIWIYKRPAIFHRGSSYQVFYMWR